MGNRQSSDNGGQTQVTETANFDFRNDRRRELGEVLKLDCQRGSFENNSKSFPGVSQEYDKAKHWNSRSCLLQSERRNDYWVEDGLDVLNKFTSQTMD